MNLSFRITTVVLGLLLILPVWGQSYSVGGTITDRSNRQGIEHAVVSLPALNYWASTNEKGDFLIQGIPAGNYQIYFQMMGYKDSVLTCHIDKDIADLNIRLRINNLSLKEVTVTARENTFGSSSQISREAIEHIQPKSLNDVFQLLPGQVSENPNLNAPKQIRIRDISNNNNSSLGALLIVNDMPVSDDANMQAFSTAQRGLVAGTPGHLGKGSDLREISAENIESVEVIRGIPSSEYGNLTSGVVRVTTKIGKTPYRVNLKTDLQSKIASIQKGFNLPQHAGAMNLGLDYAKAYNDIRMKFRGYERITANLSYSNTFFRHKKPLKLRFNFAPYTTLDENKTDPQLKKDEEIKSKKSGFRIGVNGEWLLACKWISNLEYNISGSYTQITDYQKRLMVLSSGAVPNPTSRVSGEFPSDYLPGIFYSEYGMDGKPYTFAAKIKANLAKKIGISSNKLIGGVEYMINGNSGKGLEYDPARPPMNVLSNSSRPRPLLNIPRLQHLSAFIENKSKLQLGSTRLTWQAGARFSSALPGNIFALEPRFIASYELLNSKNNSVLDKLSLNTGWGKAVKMPPLIYLSPDDSYFDDTALNHLSPKNGSLAVINTTVLKQGPNPDLKPMSSIKKEIGLEMRKGPVSAQITFYSERTDHCYSFEREVYIKPYRKFIIEAGGTAPVFENGSVFYTKDGSIVEAKSETDTVFRIYNIPTNNGINIKKGIEYVVKLGKIEALMTSFTIDGAWMYEEQVSTRPQYTEIHALHPSKPNKVYPYLPLMPAGESTIKQRLNTNLRSITHIPAIRMIFSLTTQIIWDERYRYRWENEKGETYVYYYDSQGQRIDGSPSAYERRPESRHVDPIGFIDYSGNFHPWDKSYSKSPEYGRMVNSFNRDYYFVEDVIPTLIQFNFRMTKEFTDYIAASFMVNNFFKMHPYVLNNRSGAMIKQNDKLYFGAELNIKF